MAEERTVGIYVHTPFCASRCRYCDFCSLAGRDALMPEYQSALLRHIREAAPRLSGTLVDTVYFGGGTPSYYGARRIVQLFEELTRSCDVLRSAEVTVEVNPDSATPDALKALRRAGVNRLSMGIQSANDDLLRILGRRHSFEQAKRAMAGARAAGFANVSVDLMYGLPTQTRLDWSDTLERVVALKPQHISCYALTLEEGTPMWEYRDSGLLPDDDMQADMYLYAVEALSRAGYRQYEISNFAQTGMESRHNLRYWQLRDYMGFGASAASNMGRERYTCLRDVDAYVKAVLKGGEIICEQESLTAFQRAAEYLMLGLRTTWGISAQECGEIFKSDFAPIERLLESYVPKGLARKIGERWSLTPTGFLISNRLIGEVLDMQAEQRAFVATPWRVDI